MRVLGIDPGSFSTGYGIIGIEGDLPIYLGDGVISLKGELPQRLKRLYDGIKGVISRYRPEAIAVESPFVAKNVKSALRLGQIQAVVSLAAADSLLPLYEYSPMEVKIALTGYGRATKEQVREMVKRLLGLEEDPSLDASDALAVAICHLHRAWQ